jgi:hypothetical protein
MIFNMDEDEDEEINNDQVSEESIYNTFIPKAEAIPTKTAESLQS